MLILMPSKKALLITALISTQKQFFEQERCWRIQSFCHQIYRRLPKLRSVNPYDSCMDHSGSKETENGTSHDFEGNEEGSHAGGDSSEHLVHEEAIGEFEQRRDEAVGNCNIGQQPTGTQDLMLSSSRFQALYILHLNEEVHLYVNDPKQVCYCSDEPEEVVKELNGGEGIREGEEVLDTDMD